MFLTLKCIFEKSQGFIFETVATVDSFGYKKIIIILCSIILVRERVGGKAQKKEADSKGFRLGGV